MPRSSRVRSIVDLNAGRRLITLARKYRTYADQKAMAEEEMKRIAKRITAITGTSKLPAPIDTDPEDPAEGYTIQIVEQPGRDTIVAGLLLEQGVTPKQIRKATKSSPPYSYPVVVDKAEALRKAEEKRAEKLATKGSGRGRRSDED